MMLGYYGDESASQEAVTWDGWMKTGDLATFDYEGYCSIVGRSKDTIIRGGENIAPREVIPLASYVRLSLCLNNVFLHIGRRCHF